MINKAKIWFPLLFIILFQNCDPCVNDSVFDSNNLVSVSSFISPQDTLFTAYLFHGQSLETTADPALAVITDALVYITDGENTDTLSFQKKNLRYEGEINKIQIKSLKTYFLRVILKNGQILQASCLVPNEPEIPTIQGTREGDDFKFSVSWNSTPFGPYSILSADARGTYEVTIPAGPTMARLNAILDNGTYILSDKKTNLEFGVVGRAFLAESPELIVYIRNIDRNMFLYYDSFRKLDDWHSNNGNLIPNFREPSPLFSIINGGIGIFGAYNLITQNLRID